MRIAVLGCFVIVRKYIIEKEQVNKQIVNLIKKNNLAQNGIPENTYIRVRCFSELAT